MCVEYSENIHNALFEHLKDDKPLTVYKAYWIMDYTDGKVAHPVFGDPLCSIIMLNNKLPRRWDYEKNKSVEFDGWQQSKRQDTGLTEADKQVSLMNDGLIPGLHSFLYPRDAIIWSWHWAGMLGRPISVLQVQVHRDDFICGGIGGYDIREYDTCENGPAVISTKVQVSVDDLQKPIWLFEGKSLGKKALLTALAQGKKIREKPKAMSNFQWKGDDVKGAWKKI